MIRKLRKGIAAAASACLLVGATSVAYGQARDDFPTCYGMLGDTYQAKPAERELFVIVDQTLVYDLTLKRHVHDKVTKFIRPGDRITLLTFSAYAKGRYDQMTLTGQLDQLLTDDDRYNVNKTKLRKFDSCIGNQQSFALMKINQALKEALEGGSTELPRTELLGAMGNFSQSIFGNTSAGKRSILLVSDMMENSDQISFYKNGGVDNLDPEGTLRKVKNENLLANLNDASVNVIGAGLSGSKGYLSANTLTRMRTFWEGYIEASGGQLVGWGQPQLLVPLE